MLIFLLFSDQISRGGKSLSGGKTASEGCPLPHPMEESQKQDMLISRVITSCQKSIISIIYFAIHPSHSTVKTLSATCSAGSALFEKYVHEQMIY